MVIIGCDFHTRYQLIAMMDDSTGELVERRLEHENGEAHDLYHGLGVTSLPRRSNGARQEPDPFVGPRAPSSG